MNALMAVEQIENRILIIRGEKVILDAELARLYGVTTFRLNQQVNRNRKRFPSDFCFVLTPSEKAEVIANCINLKSLKYSPALPKVFTEHGAVMAASVLNTPVAVRASIFVVRAFVRLRSLLAAHKDLAGKLEELMKKVGTHDAQIRGLFEAIRELMAPPPPKPKPRIGYQVSA
jgi:hypothetical protein